MRLEIRGAQMILSTAAEISVMLRNAFQEPPSILNWDERAPIVDSLASLERVEGLCLPQPIFSFNRTSCAILVCINREAQRLKVKILQSIYILIKDPQFWKPGDILEITC